MRCQDDSWVKGFTYIELRLFAVVPLVNWAEVANYPRIDFAAYTAEGAVYTLPRKVSMAWAHAEGRSYCEIG